MPISARFGVLLAPFREITNVGSDGYDDGRCAAIGARGRFITDVIIRPWLELGHNCTLDGYAMFGSYEDGTGLKGSFKTNSTDLSISLSTANEIQSEDYSLPMYVDNLQIFCPYPYEIGQKHLDLLDTYLSFDYPYYLATMFFLLLFILSWIFCCRLAKRMHRKLRREIRNARLPAYWLLLCAILDQDQFPIISHISFTAISTFCSLCFYLMIDCFMLNLVSTDLVSVVDPPVVRNYADILERDNLSVIFLPGTSEETIFKNSLEGSVESKIWERRHIITSLSAAVVPGIIKATIAQEVVTILNTWAATILGYVCYSIAVERGYNNKVLMTRDDTDKQVTSAYMISTYADTQLKEFVHSLSFKLNEHGLTDERGNSFDAYLDDEPLNIEEFLSATIKLPPMPLPLIELKKLKKLSILYFILLFIALMVLLYEKIKYALVEMFERMEERDRERRRKRGKRRKSI